MRSALNHPLHGYYINESSGAATITNDKDPLDKSYDLFANDLKKIGTQHANDGADQII